MEHWDLRSIAIEARKPQVLHSTRGESRSVAIALTAGEALTDHQVHERAHVVVIEGDVEVTADGSSLSCGPGTLVVFDPNERHEVRAGTDARLLLVLAPWPGPGHPGARD
jgi:quercetin dioxygenase-like cupin family protein